MYEQTTMGVLVLELIVWLVAFDKVKNPNGRQTGDLKGMYKFQKIKYKIGLDGK